MKRFMLSYFAEQVLNDRPVITVITEPEGCVSVIFRRGRMMGAAVAEVTG